MTLLHFLEAGYAMGAFCWFVAAAYTLRSRRKLERATILLQAFLDKLENERLKSEQSNSQTETM